MTARLYLAGPISGVPGHNFAAFAEAAAAIRAMGFPVYSPTEASAAEGFDPATDTQRPLADYLARDLPHVLAAPSVVVLPGWRQSRGALAELFVAVSAGIRVAAYPSMATVEPAEIVGAIADCHPSRGGFSAISPAERERTPAAGPLADTSHAGLWRSAALPWELTP